MVAALLEGGAAHFYFPVKCRQMPRGETMAELSELRVQLESRRTELQRRIESIKADVSQSHSSDWSEQAQERENDEVLDQLGGNAEQELRDVNSALDRMRNDEYGLCVSCQQEIPMARLEIKPEAAECVNCAD